MKSAWVLSYKHQTRPGNHVPGFSWAWKNNDTKNRTQGDVIWLMIFHRTVFSTSLKPQRLSWPFLFLEGCRDQLDVNGFWKVLLCFAKRNLFTFEREKPSSCYEEMSNCALITWFGFVWRWAVVNLTCLYKIGLVLRREPCLDAGILCIKNTSGWCD